MSSVESAKCKVWGVESKVYSEECGLRSVNCSLKCNV